LRSRNCEPLDGILNVPVTTVSFNEEATCFGAYFSNSSCVILDNDVWSMVSINETAPIYTRRKIPDKDFQKEDRKTNQTRQVIARLTL
jgi:hypothetical protein